MTFCDTTAGIAGSFRTDRNKRMDGTGWTDRRRSQNIYLDDHYPKKNCKNSKDFLFGLADSI